MARGKSKNADTKAGNGNGANMGFEAQMFLAADKLRKNLEPSDEKHVALGLIFLKYISNTLEAKQSILDKPVRLLTVPLLPPTNVCQRALYSRMSSMSTLEDLQPNAAVRGILPG